VARKHLLLSLFYTEDGGICSTGISVNCFTLHYILVTCQLLQWQPQTRHNINFFPLARYGTIYLVLKLHCLFKHFGLWHIYSIISLSCVTNLIKLLDTEFRLIPSNGCVFVWSQGDSSLWIHCTWTNVESTVLFGSAEKVTGISSEEKTRTLAWQVDSPPWQCSAHDALSSWQRNPLQKGTIHLIRLTQSPVIFGSFEN
jgi:hypothetical protein